MGLELGKVRGMEGTVGRMLKAGKRTYFFDVKQTKTGEKYLIVTESRLVGEGQNRERSSVMVFAEALDKFVETLGEVAKSIPGAAKKEGLRLST